MWAHYADSHFGAMIVFKPSVESPSCFWPAVRVIYSEQIPSFGTLKEIARHALGLYTYYIPDKYRQYAYNKHGSWSYEEEWRVIYIAGSGHPIDSMKERDEEHATYIKFNPEEILEICLGYKVDEKEKARLLDLLLSSKETASIPIRQARVNRKTRLFEFR